MSRTMFHDIEEIDGISVEEGEENRASTIAQAIRPRIAATKMKMVYTPIIEQQVVIFFLVHASALVCLVASAVHKVVLDNAEPSRKLSRELIGQELARLPHLPSSVRKLPVLKFEP